MGRVLPEIKRMNSVSEIHLFLREESTKGVPLQKRNKVSTNTPVTIDYCGRVVRGTRLVSIARGGNNGGRLFTIHMLYFSLFNEKLFPIRHLAIEQTIVRQEFLHIQQFSDAITCKSRRILRSIKYDTDMVDARDAWSLKCVSKRHYGRFSKRRFKRFK